MAHWLLKSEPAKYPWEQMVKTNAPIGMGCTISRPRSNMKAMKEGERAFFYHSNEARRSSA